MGQLRFTIPQPEQVSDLAVECAYLAGMGRDSVAEYEPPPRRCLDP